MRKILLAAFVVLVSAVAPAHGDEVLSYWVQLGPGGAAEVRAVVSGERCPVMRADAGADIALAPRAPADANFTLVCGAQIPAGATSTALKPDGFEEDARQLTAEVRDESGRLFPFIAGWELPVPTANPRRIVVLGDTGCRIKGKKVQNCGDPSQWPFARIAGAAAKLKPDLVIHVGDYISRETACPAGNIGCAGSPFGDNWKAWDVDFFAPAAPLLAAAPMVFVRGNHEECGRSGSGWLRLLGPQAFAADAPCVAHLAPYSISLGSLNLMVMDDANAPDTALAAEMVPVYRAEIAGLAEAPIPSWLLLHRPIWGAISGPLGLPVGGNRTLIAAAGEDGIPSPIELMLAGHIHSFEAMNYGDDDQVPPQIIAGFGGDVLERTPRILKGTIFQGDSGVIVKDGISLSGFGFLLMSRADEGWAIDVYDARGEIERTCFFHGRRLGCPKKN